MFKYNTHENDWDEKCGGTLTFDKGRIAVQVSAYMHVCVCEREIVFVVFVRESVCVRARICVINMYIYIRCPYGASAHTRR